MPSPKFRIIDADGHVMEPPGMWERYIGPEYRDRAPRVVRGPSGRSGFESGGRVSPRPECISLAMRGAFAARVREHLGEYLEAEYNAESQIKAMDAGGIEIAFLYPTQGLYMASIDDLAPELAIAICRAYNDWMLDFCAAAPDRLRPVGMLVALHDPTLAAQEVERLAARGFKAVFVRPNPIRGRNLDDPAYEPFWAACERRGLAGGIHEGGGGDLPQAGAPRVWDIFPRPPPPLPLEQMRAKPAHLCG